MAPNISHSHLLRKYDLFKSFLCIFRFSQIIGYFHFRIGQFDIINSHILKLYSYLIIFMNGFSVLYLIFYFIYLCVVEGFNEESWQMVVFFLLSTTACLIFLTLGICMNNFYTREIVLTLNELSFCVQNLSTIGCLKLKSVYKIYIFNCFMVCVCLMGYLYVLWLCLRFYLVGSYYYSNTLPVIFIEIWGFWVYYLFIILASSKFCAHVYSIGALYQDMRIVVSQLNSSLTEVNSKEAELLVKLLILCDLKIKQYSDIIHNMTSVFLYCIHINIFFESTYTITNFILQNHEGFGLGNSVVALLLTSMPVLFSGYQEQSFKNEVHRLSVLFEEKENVKYEAEILNLQLSHCPLEFRPGGFYRINAGFLPSMFGIIASYVVLFVQLGRDMSSCRKNRS